MAREVTLPQVTTYVTTKIGNDWLRASYGRTAMFVEGDDDVYGRVAISFRRGDVSVEISLYGDEIEDLCRELLVAKRDAHKKQMEAFRKRAAEREAKAHGA